MTVAEALTAPYPKALRDHPTLRQSKLADFDRCTLMSKFALEEGREWAPVLKVRSGLARAVVAGAITEAQRQELIADLPSWGLAPAEHGWGTHQMARGQLVHRAIAKCLREMHNLQEDRIPTMVAEAIFEETLRQHDVPAHEMVAYSAEQVADMRWVVRKWASETQWTIGNLVSVEEQLETSVHYPSDYGPIERVLTGRSDAMFAQADHAIIPDWKDTWALPPETEVSFGGYFQQRFYAFGVFKHPWYRAINVVTLKEWYLRYSEPRSVTIRREELPEIESEMAALAERFDRAWETDTHRPTPGKHCAYCLMPERCPIERSARGIGSVTDEDSARLAVAEMHVADQIKKKRWESIKNWAQVRGFVPLADAKGRRRGYGFKASETKVKPGLEEFERELRRVGSIDRMDLSKLWRVRKGTRFTEMDAPFQEPTAEDQNLAEQLRKSIEEADARRAARNGA